MSSRWWTWSGGENPRRAVCSITVNAPPVSARSAMIRRKVPPVKRTYRSRRRRDQARTTRRAIVAAAGRLFVDAGYGATTQQQIADEAGVAVQTIYATFGTKRAILEQLLDTSIAGDDAPIVVNDRDWMREVFRNPDTSARLHAYAAAVAGSPTAPATSSPSSEQLPERIRTWFRSLRPPSNAAGTAPPELSKHSMRSTPCAPISPSTKQWTFCGRSTAPRFINVSYETAAGPSIAIGRGLPK